MPGYNTLNVNVAHQELIYTEPVLTTDYTAGYLKIAFHFLTDEWENITKYVVFGRGKIHSKNDFTDSNGDTPAYTYELPADGVATVPYQVLKTDEHFFSFGIYGVNGNNIIPTQWMYSRVANGAYITGVEPGEPMPDIINSLAQRVADVEDSLNDKLNKSGGTMTGNLTIFGNLMVSTNGLINIMSFDPSTGQISGIRNVINNGDAANKKYVDQRAAEKLDKNGVIDGQLTFKKAVTVDANEYYLNADNTPSAPSRVEFFDNGANTLPATAQNDKQFRAYVQSTVEGGKNYVAVMRFTVLEFKRGIMQLTRLFSHTNGKDGFDRQDQVLIENVIPNVAVGETYTVAYEKYLPDDTDVTRIGFAIKNSLWGGDPTCKIRVENMYVYPAAQVGSETLTDHAVVTLSGVYSDAAALFDGMKTAGITANGLICGHPGQGATFSVITRYREMLIEGDRITGLASPTENTDAVNKAYADTKLGKTEYAGYDIPLVSVLNFADSYFNVGEIGENGDYHYDSPGRTIRGEGVTITFPVRGKRFRLTLTTLDDLDFSFSTITYNGNTQSFYDAGQESFTFDEIGATDVELYLSMSNGIRIDVYDLPEGLPVYTDGVMRGEDKKALDDLQATVAALQARIAALEAN